MGFPCVRRFSLGKTFSVQALSKEKNDHKGCGRFVIRNLLCRSRIISRVLSSDVAVIPLGARSPAPSSNLPERYAAGRATFPIWSCSRRVCRAGYVAVPSGGLLPHRFTLTMMAVCFLLHSRGSPLLGVTQRPALLSPDFPLRNYFRSDGPSGSCANTLVFFLFLGSGLVGYDAFFACARFLRRLCRGTFILGRGLLLSCGCFFLGA